MTLHDTVHAFVRQGFTHAFGEPRVDLAKDAEWTKVRATGTQLWLDTGDMEEALQCYTADFEALTTNNTLLNREVQKGIYDSLIPEAAKVVRGAAPSASERDVLLEIGFILNAYHALRLVEEFDAYVSVELHTDLANDVERSVEYGRRYYAICPERFIVKIPLTPAGYLSARQLSLEGIPINFTLGFSARHNYVAALVSQPAYVNVFLGRIGAFLDDNELGSPENAGEKASLSTQRELLTLRETGRSETRLIAASMRNASQVADLAGTDVYTMPPKVAVGYLKEPSETVSNQVENDPAPSLSDGVSLEDFAGSSLWEVSDGFKEVVKALLNASLDSLSAAAVQDHFASSGFGDFLPHWSEEDIQTVTDDGKIPVFATWQDRLSSGAIGLDALLNVSALYSFATDQKALDDRIESLI